jgi:ABC-2 type transport system permease protein
MLRAPGFAAPFLLLPFALYLLFGVVMAGASSSASSSTTTANYLFVGFAVFAIVGPALFGIGIPLATERDAGLMRLKRALPAPAGAYLAAKMLMAMVFAGLAMGSVVAAAALAHSLTLSAAQLLAIALVLMAGAVPFCAIGLFIGAYASGSAAPAFANLAYLPMLYLSGLFFPLPKALQPWQLLWPTFHLEQLALAAAGLAHFTLLDPKIYAVVLVAVSVVFGGLSLRRLARTG